MNIRADIQLHEGSNTVGTGSLLDILLAVDIQVLEGLNIGDITGLPNVLLVGMSLGMTLRCLGPPKLAILGTPTSAILGRHYQLFSGFKAHKLLALA